MSDMNKGTGRIAPLDVKEFIEVTVTVEGDFIADAHFVCTDDPVVRDCANAVCEVMKEKPFRDVMQMNGNAVIYNTECDLERGQLYLASMAVMAAKRAVADYSRKNGITLPSDDTCHCE